MRANSSFALLLHSYFIFIFLQWRQRNQVYSRVLNVHSLRPSVRDAIRAFFHATVHLIDWLRTQDVAINFLHSQLIQPEQHNDDRKLIYSFHHSPKCDAPSTKKQPKNEKWPATNTKMLLMCNVWFTDKPTSKTKPNSWRECTGFAGRMGWKLIHFTRLYEQYENIFIFYEAVITRDVRREFMTWNGSARMPMSNGQAKYKLRISARMHVLHYGAWKLQWSMRPCGRKACSACLPNMFRFQNILFFSRHRLE